MYPNNQQTTAGRLQFVDTLASAPGDTPLDKEHAWNKLQPRLSDKPVRKMTYWYCSAAACILLAIGIWLAGRQEETLAVTPSPAPAQTPSMARTPDAPAPPEIRQKPTPTIAKATRPRRKNTPVHTVSNLPGIETLKTDTLFVTRLPELKIFDSNMTGLPIAEKKKLKVVHINQLKGPDFPPVMVSGKPVSSKKEGSIMIRLN